MREISSLHVMQVVSIVDKYAETIAEDIKKKILEELDSVPLAHRIYAASQVKALVEIESKAYTIEMGAVESEDYMGDLAVENGAEALRAHTKSSFMVKEILRQINAVRR